MTEKTLWRWKEGAVDERKEHIELRYGDAEKTSYDNWMPIARISKPKRHVFIVEWLDKQDAPLDQDIMARARRDLDFFLVEHELNVTSTKDLDPGFRFLLDHWNYAIYHCSTAGNMYSQIHWSYFPEGIPGERQASEVIELSAEKSAKVFGDSRGPGKYIVK